MTSTKSINKIDSDKEKKFISPNRKLKVVLYRQSMSSVEIQLKVEFDMHEKTRFGTFFKRKHTNLDNLFFKNRPRQLQSSKLTLELPICPFKGPTKGIDCDSFSIQIK
jgi:hypothetical protein